MTGPAAATQRKPPLGRNWLVGTIIYLHYPARAIAKQVELQPGPPQSPPTASDPGPLSLIISWTSGHNLALAPFSKLSNWRLISIHGIWALIPSTTSQAPGQPLLGSGSGHMAQVANSEGYREQGSLATTATYNHPNSTSGLSSRPHSPQKCAGRSLSTEGLGSSCGWASPYPSDP